MVTTLRIGDRSENGQVTIVDEDRLCYLVKSDSKGAEGVRTISKALLKEFVIYIRQHPDSTSIEARNALVGRSEIDRFEYGYNSTLAALARMVIAKSDGMPQVYQEKGAVLQQIFYGAPGTGKSHAIKELTDAWEKQDRVVRTTFHPDSDYSTFVGCYKPTTEEVVRRDQDDNETTEKVISYDFVGQAFLSAYVDAWKDRTQPEFLVIEEINRGNCAQIFGDLFQLLDRGDDGYSEYAIRADKDLQKYLEAAFNDVEIADYPKVKAGTELMLPQNFRIWATMNTSDQSLFPIDSAFKRRWDWKYIPIAQGEQGGMPLDWRVEAGGKLYDWWDFLKKINTIVLDTTNSADKQMGFFFCKAQKNVISAETFVSKVVFYLWNDVFKDYGFDDQVFNDGQTGSGEKLKFDTFYDARGEVVVEKIQRFFENLGVKPVELSEEDAEDEQEETDEEEETNADNSDETEKKRTVDTSSFSINGIGAFKKKFLAVEVMKLYLQDNPQLSEEEIIESWDKLRGPRGKLVYSEEGFADYINNTEVSKRNGRINRFNPVDLKNGRRVFVANQFKIDDVERFMQSLQENNMPYRIERLSE